MSLNNEEREAVVMFRIEKAQRAYREAKGVVEKQYWETIANRLYYAAYNAVSSLLIANGDTAQTHQGIQVIFGKNFIKTGIIDTKYGSLYHKLFSMRLTGDYDDTYGLTENDVLPLIEPTGDLIETVTELAKQKINNLH